MRVYVVDRVPPERVEAGEKDLWYVHLRGYSYVPVFGSIGSKAHAESVCRKYNLDGKVKYK